MNKTDEIENFKEATFKSRQDLRAHDGFIVDPIFPTHSLHLIGGPPSIGKTTWLFQMLRDWDQGKDVLGGKSSKVPWIYVSGDRGDIDMDRTLRRLGMGDWKLPGGSIEKFTDMAEPDLCRVIKRLRGVRLVVVEGLQSFIPEPQGMSANKAQMLWVGKLRREFLNSGGTIIGITHTPKSNMAHAESMNFLGTQSLMASSGTLINIGRPDSQSSALVAGLAADQYRQITISGKNFAMRKLLYEVDENGFFMPYDPTVIQPSANGESSGADDVYILDRVMTDLPSGIELPSKHFIQVGKSYGVSRATVCRWIDKQVIIGRLEKVRYGYYRKPTLASSPDNAA